MSELTILWGLDTHPERTFVGLSEPGDTAEEREAFTVSSAALRGAVAGLTEGVSACVCVGGGNPPGIHNTQDPAPAALPMDVYKAQFAFNFGASALTVSACIDALLTGRGNVVLTSSVNGILGIGEVGYSVSKASMHPYAPTPGNSVCTALVALNSQSQCVSVAENSFSGSDNDYMILGSLMLVARSRYVHNLASHYGPQGLNANAVALGTVGPTGAPH